MDFISEKVSKICEIQKKYPQNLGAACFDPEYFATLDLRLQQRFLQCLNSGIENPGSQIGCYACRPDDYDVFEPYFTRLLEAYHKVDLSKVRHRNNWSFSGLQGVPPGGTLDLGALGLGATSMRIRTARNLKRFPLPGSMNMQQRIELEAELGKVFAKLYQMEGFGGRYYSITPGHPDFIDEAQYQRLVGEHLMFKDMSADRYLAAAGISADWPYGRGCYISANRNFIIWVGEEDHLRIISMKNGRLLNELLDELKLALDLVESLIEGGCAHSGKFGVIASCPSNTGTAMRASVHLQLPCLTAGGKADRVQAICAPLGLSIRGTGGEHTPIGSDGTVDLSPSARFCISEAEIVLALYRGIELLLEKERSGA